MVNLCSLWYYHLQSDTRGLVKWLFWWDRNQPFASHITLLPSCFWLLLGHMGRECLKTERMTLVSQHGWVDLGGGLREEKKTCFACVFCVVRHPNKNNNSRILGYYFNEYRGWLDSSCMCDSPISFVKHAINPYWTDEVLLCYSIMMIVTVILFSLWEKCSMSLFFLFVLLDKISTKI